MAKRRGCCARSLTDPVRAALAHERKAEAALADARRRVVDSIAAAIKSGCTVPAIAQRVVEPGDPSETLKRRDRARKAINERLRRASMRSGQRSSGGRGSMVRVPTSVSHGVGMPKRKVIRREVERERVVEYFDGDQTDLDNAESDGQPLDDSRTVADDDQANDQRSVETTDDDLDDDEEE